MQRWFVGYCPCSDQCAKGGKRLGSRQTDAQCRAMIAGHLQNSSYHMLSADDALALANEATLDLEEYPAEECKDKPDKPRVADARSSPYVLSAHEATAKATAKVIGTPQPTEKRRQPTTPLQGPAAPAPPPPKELPLQLSNSNSSSSLAPSMDKAAGSNIALIFSSVQKSEQAARASARIARQAAAAFDEEAENFAAAARQIRQAMDANY